MKRLTLILGAFSMMLLAGCTVGPKYARPNVATAPVDAFKETDGWKPARPSDQLLRGKWWEIFADPQLIARALRISEKTVKARFLDGTEPAGT